jgi:hypothetical protein
MPADEFYVGYLPRAPKPLARVFVRIVAATIVFGLAIAVVLVFGQQPFLRATFEFGQDREFTGRIELRPYPALLVSRPGAVGNQLAYSRYLLAAPGKHGADAEVRRFSNQLAHLRGSLIYRDSQTMIELMPGSVAVQGPAFANPPLETALGSVTVIGEIMDSKCYLGVMNPGRTKVHRDCAARCISGGIPPMLLTPNALYLLVGADGRKLNQELLQMVGETVEVHGDVLQSGETLTLYSEPGSYKPSRRPVG